MDLNNFTRQQLVRLIEDAKASGHPDADRVVDMALDALEERGHFAPSEHQIAALSNGYKGPKQ